MKKILTLTAFFALCAGLIFTLSSCGIFEMPNKGIKYELSEDGSYYKVVGYEGTSTDIEIPETHAGKPVKEIASWAFESDSNFRDLLLMIYSSGGQNNSTISLERASTFETGVSVTYSKGNAQSLLQGVLSGGSFIIPNVPQRQGGSSVSIKSISIPSSVTIIDPYAFVCCFDLANINISSNNPEYQSIDGDIYTKNNKTLIHATVDDSKSITVSDGTVGIYSYAFYAAVNLENLTIPASVTEIQDGERIEFITVRNLKTISVDEKNPIYKSIDGNLYTKDGKTFLKYAAKKEGASLTIPEGVTHISSNAFGYCTSLERVVIPDSVTSIGNFAFSNCGGLTSITIPDSVTSIGSCAFQYCSSLNAVYITDIAKWCAIDFGDIDANPLTYARNLYFNGELVTDLVIPEGVTNIGKALFQNCSSLTSVTLGNSVKEIGDGAFYDCTNLVSVTMGDSVTAIGKAAFQKCSGLESINISNGITKINDFVFQNCLNLINIAIPDHVTEIGKSAFDGCSNLASVNIPDGITSIGDFAFYNCTSLTNVVIPDGVTKIGSLAFYNCQNLKICAEAQSRSEEWHAGWCTVSHTTLYGADAESYNGSNGVNWINISGIPVNATVEWGYNPSDAE